MKSALQWIRINLVTVGCILVIAVSAEALFFWPTVTHGSSLVAQMEKDRGGIPARIDNLHKTPVPIPPTKPGESERKIPWPVNRTVLEKLKDVYQQRDAEFSRFHQIIESRNNRSAQVLLNNLFPKPRSEAERLDSRAKYQEAIVAIYAALRAGSPPDADTIAKRMADEEQKFRNAYLISTNLNAEQEQKLAERQSRDILKLFQRAADGISIYADPVGRDRNAGWLNGPFQVGEWSHSDSPKMFDIWEGQMQLWIQQDLATAIALTNQIQTETPVTTTPIKKLISMKTVGGYIGIATDNRLGNRPAAPSAADVLPDNFAISPTGRQSNALYDVRHAELSVIIDSQQIPKLLNAIGQTNLMTVIAMRTTDVDEYQELQQGYFYGNADVVQLDLYVESLWLRSWTAGHNSPEDATAAKQPFNGGLMPDEVRHYLGLPTRETYTPAAGSGNEFRLTNEQVF